LRKDIVQTWATQNNITINDTQLQQLETFQDVVLKANEKVNLTAITTDEDFAIKHIIDSMTLLPYINDNSTIIDIGTGAGFPGLVLRILRENICLTLLDSRKKRVEFLRHALDSMNFTDVQIAHARAEDWARQGATYDICTARAVAPLDKLVGYALPLVKLGGLLLAMKGPDIKDELKKAEPAIKKKGGVLDKVDTVEIAQGLKHSIVIIKRV